MDGELAGIFEEIAGDIEVADVTGGAAELTEEACHFPARMGVAGVSGLGFGQAGQEREQRELGLDAAGEGAEEMDGALLRVGEHQGDSGFERGDLLAEGFEGMNGLRGGRHGGWMIAGRAGVSLSERLRQRL